jgi:hypothetical protein
MSNAVEVLWLQVPLPHLKPLLLRCWYRPPSANSNYFDNRCAVVDSVCDVNRGVYCLGDLNIDWLASSCPLKRKLLTVTNACAMTQVLNQATRVHTNSVVSVTYTCIDHICTALLQCKISSH